MRHIFTILSIIFGLLGLATVFRDVTTPEESWVIIGRLWFEWAPNSLQVTEAIISRYIDPCGLIASLNCSPFLWHPVLSATLNWYAVPTFFILAFAFAGLARYRGKRKKF